MKHTQRARAMDDPKGLDLHEGECWHLAYPGCCDMDPGSDNFISEPACNECVQEWIETGGEI